MHKKAEGMGRELGLPPSQTLTAPVRDLRILSAHGHISILQISKGALNITEKNGSSQATDLWKTAGQQSHRMFQIFRSNCEVIVDGIHVYLSANVHKRLASSMK
ncbi:uncharacterized protein LOC144333657 [Macaca mulatta]